MCEITANDQIDFMGPLTEIDDIGKVGTCVGLTADKDFIYAAFDEGTNTIIYKGREITRTIGNYETLRWEWCPFIFLSTNACSSITVCQHSASDRRLWFGYGANAGFVILSDDPVADSDYRYTSSGFVRIPYIYGTDQYWDKIFHSVITETANCSSTITVRPYYRKDTDTSVSALTAAITTNGTVKTNLSVTTTGIVSAKRIQFELDLATTDSAISPECRFFQVRGTEKPEEVRIHESVYSLGTSPAETAKTLRDYLRGGRTSTSLIKFADLRYGQKTSGTTTGDYVWVSMMPSYPQEIEVSHGKNEMPELGLKCVFKEIPYTIS
jgi:hypothetical protein